MFDSYLNESILGRAVKEKLIDFKFYNPRDFVKAGRGNYKPVDDKPYGGGPGMVMRVEPLAKAVGKAVSLVKRKKKYKLKVVNFTPSGKEFNTSYAKRVVGQKYTDIILICGRYEGVDARVKKIFRAENISVGNYVLTGGELAAMIYIDSTSRQIKGVLGSFDSLEESRISSSEVYTRPEKFEYGGKKYKVPKVLLSGNHKKIEEWKKQG